MMSDKICNDGVCDVNDKLINMSMANKEDNGNVSICANCGKEGSDVNNICNKCKITTYCNAACKKKHRHKHKKECEEYVRLAAKRAAELHDIELFKQPPSQYGDCAICFLRLPMLDTGSKYMSCCGKIICGGCCYAPVYDDQGNEVDSDKCPFCRTPWHSSDEELLTRYKKRMDVEDGIAIYNQGNYYRNGKYGLPQDHEKALELYHWAAELGLAEAHSNLGYHYEMGIGVEVDMKKATYYYELAAMGGCEIARTNLGIIEKNAGNFDRALKHYMIAVRDGFAPSLKQIKLLYTNGHATKEDYTTALRLYQEYLGEIKSDQRDKAAAADGEYRYY